MENKLWYKASATCFGEALPLGNGKLGAMVYGKGGTEKISLNYDELWSGKPTKHVRKGAYEVYKKAQEAMLSGDPAKATELIENGFNCMYTDFYVPLGDLFIEGLSAETDDYYRELNLENGIASVTYGDKKRSYFCSYKENALIIRIENESDFKIYLNSPHVFSTSAENGVYCLDGECPSYMLSAPQNVMNENLAGYIGDGIHFAAAVSVNTDGKAEYTNDAIIVSGADKTEIILHVQSSFIDYKTTPDAPYKEPCIEETKKIAEKDYTAVLNEHTEYFTEKYNRVKLNLNLGDSDNDTLYRLKNPDDGLVELLFNFGRYLIISASAPGSQATNLQGIWNDQYYGPWNCGYTTNINFEMNYWPVLMCNLPEFYGPMIELIKNVSENGKSTAKDYYHARGFAVHHNTDIWALTNPVGDRLESVRWGFWHGAGGWLCEHLFEYYEYTEDIDFLRETAYPIMKECAKFYLDILVEYEDRLIITPATSPENGYILNGEEYFVAKWSTMYQAIVSELFGHLVRCCDILGVDDDFKATLLECLPKLKPFEIADDGRLLEWDKNYEEIDVNHRHVSHMYGLFPADDISTDTTPELAEACRQSLLVRGDDSTGWSLGWKANLWAKLKDGDHSLRVVKRQLNHVEYTETISQGGGTFSNLFDAHPPFQIDGNYGITSAIAQMFLQSEDNKIKILPALPTDFKDGNVSGLLAKGNVEVSIEWADGKATKTTLTSKKDKTVTVMIDGKDYEVQLKAGTPAVL